MSDKVKLTIDGVETEVPKGTTVLQAAGRLAIDVPRYCYHPGLTIAGNCRICLVDIEKMPKLATSCTTVAADGMVVRTSGQKVEEGRRAVMEFLLANHPLDCPICDQAGECWLQEYSFRHGAGASRMREERIQGFKNKSVGPHVVLDTERCIVCTRCVRFCQEVTGTGELGVIQRGVYSYIDVFPGREMDNPYSGNTVDICPVGALTLKEFRFKKRVWELKDVPSVCGSCARGCNVNLGTADNKIWRLTPRENPHVNKWWMCDEGRLSHERLYASTRLTRAVSAQGVGDGQRGELGWPAALDLLAERLGQAIPGRAAAIASASLTLEDFYVLRELFKEILRSPILVLETMRGEDDAILIRADKTPNAAGAEALGLSVDRGNRKIAALQEETAAGKVATLLLLGDDVVERMGDQIGLVRGHAFVCAFTAFDTPAARSADLALPAAAYGEVEGTWVNFEGRAQRVRSAVTPPGVALEGWRMLSEVAARLGGPLPYASSAEVLRRISAAGGRFQAIPDRGIGPLGVQL